jgi:phenylacetate-CoA ligase
MSDGSNTSGGPGARELDQPFWDRDAQTMSVDARRALQDGRLRALVRRIFETPVPFFVRKLKEAGVDRPEAVEGVRDLASIPITRKQELRDSEAAHPPLGDYRFVGLRDAIRIGETTGTTGKPTALLFTRRDLLIEYESASRGLWRRGYRPGMIATHAHPAYLYAGGWMVSSAHEYFGLVNLWVPPPETDALAESGLRAWMRFRPDIPFQGFAMGRYLEVAQKLGLDPEKDLGLPARGSEGQGKLPLVTAGLECYSFLGSVCRANEGGHINEDWAIVQAIDPLTGREVEDGAWGNLVVTTLDRDGALIRYDLEEACAIVRTPCACGETTARGFWGGRFRDLLFAQGRRFRALDLERALGTVEMVAHPSLEWVVVRPKDPDRALHVRVELAAGDRSDATRRCEDAIREALGVESRVEIVDRGALARSGYKAVRVIDGG